MNTTLLIDECLEQGLLRHKLVDTTVKSYRWHLRRFAGWLTAQALDTPDPDNISRFMDHLQRDKARGGIGFAPRSTRAAWYALRYFDKWMLANKHQAVSAMPAYELPTLGDAESYVMSAHDADLLCDAVERLEDPFRKALARAVFMLVTTGGLRNCEVRKLVIADYDRQQQKIHVVKSKRKRTRWVCLCSQCCEAIDFWLTMRPAETAHKNLFCWDGVRHLGDKGLWKLMEDVSHAAGFEGVVKEHKPHAARHHAGTRALNNGETIDQVRIRLGHSDIKTTQIYLHTEEEAMHETRNSTALNQDAAKMDEEYRRYLDEMRLREETIARKAIPPPSPPPAPALESKPPKISDPRDRPKGKLRRLPPRK